MGLVGRVESQEGHVRFGGEGAEWVSMKDWVMWCSQLGRSATANDSCWAGRGSMYHYFDEDYFLRLTHGTLIWSTGRLEGEN